MQVIATRKRVLGLEHPETLAGMNDQYPLQAYCDYLQRGITICPVGQSRWEVHRLIGLVLGLVAWRSR